jgi:hypothetical protein
MFKQATGMLGWTPEQALLTPIPWLKLAIDGRIEWECRKNGKEPPKRKRQSGPDPEKVQQDIKAALRGISSARKAGRKQKAAKVD